MGERRTGPLLTWLGWITVIGLFAALVTMSVTGT